MSGGIAARTPPQETREAILDAAGRRFARFGPRKTTMEEVAREAGCSRATLYTHFPGKSALYEGLLVRETEAFLVAAEAAVDGEESAPRKLVGVMEAAIGVYSESPLLVGAMAGDDDMSVEGIARPVVDAHERDVVRTLAGAVDEGIEDGAFRPVDAEAVGALMYLLGRQLVLRHVAGQGERPLEELLLVMNDLMAFGLAKPGARGRKKR